MTPSLYIPFPTVAVPHNTTSLATGAQIGLAGSYNRQKRYLLIVTNLSTTGQTLELRTSNGKPLLTYFGATSIGLPLSDDLVLYNPDANTVNFQICQIYYDEGFAGSVPANYPGASRGSSSPTWSPYASLPSSTTAGGSLIIGAPNTSPSPITPGT